MQEYWVPIFYTINLGPKTNIGSNTNNIGSPFSIPLILGLRRILGPILIILGPHFLDMASLVAQLVKNPPVMRETWVQSLGWEDPLEKGKATHPSIPS